VARRSPSLLLVALGCAFALAAGIALALPALGRGATGVYELRPDLVQRIPSGVVTRESDGRFELGFESAVENHGRGPLRIRGRRSTDSADMGAEQLIRRTDGSHVRVPRVGRIRYTRSRGHHHWHLLGFDRYELRRASDGALVRPDRKTGFCLGDRYDSGRSSPYKPREAVYTTNCRMYEPDARSLEMAISVGYGDDYHAYLEGQSFDVTGLPAGQYELVHRVNVGLPLREHNYTNNAASVRLALTWPDGIRARPRAVVLERCQSARCAP
jgi:hypothetical protein